MEFLYPVCSDNAVLVGMSLQAIKPGLVEMSFDVVAEVSEEEDLALAVPQKGMFQHFIEQQLMGMTYSFCLVQDEVQELYVPLMAKTWLLC